MDVYILEVSVSMDPDGIWKGTYTTLAKAKKIAHNLCKSDLIGYKDAKSKIKWSMVEQCIDGGETVITSWLSGVGQATENGIKKEPWFYFKIFRLEVQ